MPFWDRIARLFEGEATPPPVPERLWAGLVGEEHATKIIQQTQPLFHRANVVVPSDGGSGRLQETDHIVLWGGTVFVVEIKNYKGVLNWADEHKSSLLQYKTGNYGEALLPKPASNPRTQATHFIRSLKRYLSTHADTRFQKLRFQPVGAFTRAADLAPIHDRAQGLLYVDELPAYFAAQQDPRFAQRPSAWVRPGLEQLPSLDVVFDERGQTHRGLLEGEGLEFANAEGHRSLCRWPELRWIEVRRDTHFFSEQDEVALYWREGASETRKFRHSTIRLRTLAGECQEMLLRGLRGMAPAPVRLPAQAQAVPRMAAPSMAAPPEIRKGSQR